MRYWLRHLLLYLYHKRKNRKLVIFSYSSYISHRSKFEGLNMVGAHSSYYGNMGIGTYIGNNCILNADIGRYTSIAPGVKCVNGTHPMKDPFVTTCPLFYSLDSGKNPQHVTFATEQLTEEFRQIDSARNIDISVGNDCWIGANVTILGGIEISDGAVVLANALVTKNVPPYAIVGGTPAKILGFRYSEKEIEFLLYVKWWEKDLLWIKENWKLMTDFDKFKDYFNYNKCDRKNF